MSKEKNYKKDLSEKTLEELWELFPVVLKEHNLTYKEWYRLERANISKCISNDYIARINHIGSTAVKSLISKPTVDILLELNKDCDLEKIKSNLEGSGWVPMHFEKKPKLKMVFNKGYTPDGLADRVYHLHVRYNADWDELYFRDYLISHKDVTKEYGKLKLDLLKKYRNNRDGYTDAKTKFIKKYTDKARKEFVGRYAPK